jgi:hypothetical protein
MAIRMRDRWAHIGWRVALALAIVVGGTPAAPLRAGDAGTTASGAPGPLPTASLAPLPLVPMPSDEDLAGAARTPVTDTPAPPPAEVDIDAQNDALLALAQAMDPEAWSTDALVARYLGDRDAAFALVRDSIGFEPYRGVMRGAEGTLAARAGDAWDRAILLRSLLDRMLFTTRFATARLDDATAERLVARAFQDPRVPLEATPADAIGLLDPAAVAARAARDYALLRGALGDRIEAMGAPVASDLVDAVRDHVWVQVAFGAEWLDLDPSMPDAQPGDVLAPATATLDAVPEELAQTIDIAVEAEHLRGETLDASTVLEASIPATDVDRQLFLYFQPDAGGLGGAIIRTLEGIDGWRPVLLIDGEATEGRDFDAGGRGTDILGDPTDAPELTALRLLVTTHAPGEPDRTATQVLLDRVPAALRDAESITGAQLQPMPTGDQGPLVFGRVSQLVISTGASSAREHVVHRGASASYLARVLEDEDRGIDPDVGNMLYPLGVAGEALAVASERMDVPSARSPGQVAAYVGRPRVFIVSVGQDALDGEELSFTTDLLLDGVDVVAATPDDVADAVRRRTWYGVLQSAVETEASLRRARAFDPGTVALEGVSFRMAEPLTLEDDAASIPPGATDGLRASVGSGLLAIVPGDPATARTWWEVDPATGATRAVLAPASGGVNGGIRWGTIRHRPPVVHRGGGGGANSWGVTRDGRIVRGYDPDAPVRRAGARAATCRGGNEETTILGCVSIPGAIALAAFGVLVGWVTYMVLVAVFGAV